MKIDLHCHICATEGHQLHLPSRASVNDLGVHPATCPVGHKSHIYLRNPKFELLFESGANALLDGYLLQSVAAFATAFERFQEFYVRAILEKWSITNDTVTETLKKEINLAERQLGAYVALFLIENGSLPTLLPKEMVLLRNKIVHRGYFPSEEEATSFGHTVLKLLVAGYKQLSEGYEAALTMIDHYSLFDQIGLLNQGGHLGEPLTYTMLTIIRTCVKYPNIPLSLIAGLDALRLRRNE